MAAVVAVNRDIIYTREGRQRRQRCRDVRRRARADSVVKPSVPPGRMEPMSENSPEPALNGHGGHLSGSALSADGLEALADGSAESVNGQVAVEPGRPTMVDDLCRLTVCGPARSVELAVPAHVPLIDLLPALIGHLGDGLADAGLEHGGWVLQRLGDPPLREELSVAALGLRDGDVVHLRPRADQLPTPDFDDLIDGIAVGIAGRTDRWHPEMSRRLLVGLFATPLAAGLALLGGHLSALSVVLAAGLAILLLALATAAARAFADMPAAGVLGAAAIAYAGLAGTELPLLSGGTSAHTLLAWSTLRAGVLAGGVAMAGTSIAVTMLSGGRHPALVGTTMATSLAGAGGALATFGGLRAASVAGVVLALAVPLGGWVPVLSFRLARMRLDPTPTNPEELQSDIDPVPGQHVLERTRWADRYMTALYCGLAVVISGCLVILGIATGLPAHAVAIDAIVLLLLHSRVLVAARHRLAAVIPAVGGAAVMITAAGLRADAHSWPVLLVGLVAAAGLLFVAERSLPGHRLLPHWGRAGDLLQSLTAVALIPLALWLLHIYSFVRSMKG
jgi:type VII secretion integral membrane protein EccD